MPFDATPLVRQDTEVTETLRRALALIEAGWTKKAAARDRWGHQRPAASPNAVRFCSIGAIHRVTSDGYMPAERALRAVLGHPHLTTWNDNPATKKRDVIRAFKKAIIASQTVVRYE